eukprot:UC1_evm1s723
MDGDKKAATAQKQKTPSPASHGEGGPHGPRGPPSYRVVCEDLDALPPLDPANWELSGVDFHVSDIDARMSRACAAVLSGVDVRSLIWHCSSKSTNKIVVTGDESATQLSVAAASSANGGEVRGVVGRGFVSATSARDMQSRPDAEDLRLWSKVAGVFRRFAKDIIATKK